MAHNRKRSNSTPPKPSNLSTISFPPVPSRLSLDHDDHPGRPSPSSTRLDDPHTDSERVQPKARKGFRRKVTSKVGELVKAGLSTPPHASHMVAGPSFIYAPDSTPLLSFAEIQRHQQLAMSGGRHHDLQGIPLPTPFFDPDIYYFAPRSNVSKRPLTAAAAESSTSLANSASSTLTRATSVGNKSSITRRRDRHASQASSAIPATPSSPPFSPSKPSTSTPSSRKRPSAGTGSTSAIPATAIPVSSEDLPSNSFEFELVDIDPSSSLPTTVNLSLSNYPAGPSYFVPPARAPEHSQDS
ncbi:10309_t:CDS:2, partial [Acaulospora colombiana]